VRHVEEFVVKDTKFEGQEKSSTALEVIETMAQIVNSTFVSNRKGLYGRCVDPNYDCKYGESIGGAIIATNSTVDISQSRFEDNGADYGGAIVAEQDSIINMIGNVFVSNNANTYGGVLYSISSTIRIEASEFHSNSATILFGGGVLCSSGSTITIEASEFHDNSARFGGVLYSISSTITIEASEFHNNSATTSNGGVLYSNSSTIRIEASEFHDNSATNKFGGVLYSDDSSSITIEGSEFHDNSANQGGVLASDCSTITIEGSEFYDNSADFGGVLDSYDSIIIIETSEFYDNNASNTGGVLASDFSTITIEASAEFHENSADWGGVLDSCNSNITIEASEFRDNYANMRGGVLYSESSNTTIAGSSFTNNVSPTGAIIYALSRSMIQHVHSFLLINNNMAGRYAVIYLFDSEFIGDESGNATFSSNLGSLVAFNSNITFSGYATFVNNQPSQTVSDDFQEGGAITLFQSNLFFDGVCNLKHNHAENGGAIHSTESKLYVNGNVTVVHNTATGNGGGVYLTTSELNCQQESTFVLWNNTASHKGGGLHAISSSIKAASSRTRSRYTGTRINITRNAAERGGGLSLEANAKVYILKYDINPGANAILFTANSAEYGGALYVDDDTNSGTCASDTETECFFQVLALQNSNKYPSEIQSMHFSQNYASISASTLYGGLLDRCAVSPFAEVHKKYRYLRAFRDRGDGIAYFKNVSKYRSLSISSDPV
jgi:predicted outer membrane repeat protein